MLIMAGYVFKPITEDDLPQVAAFLRQQQEQTSREDQTQARPSGDDLRWMLANPDLREDLPLGLSLLSPEGKLAGMILSVPRLYRLGDRRLLGLAAGDFFVDSSARLQGFFMLRRFLGLAGADFWYANSCNRQSGPLWAKCGAAMVPESDVEYLLPIRLGPIAEELAARKGWPRAVGSMLRTLGPAAAPFLKRRAGKGRFDVEYCVDLGRLADIAARSRNEALLQPDRSAAYLDWVYGSLPASPPSSQPQHVFAFRDAAGLEGWFSIRFDRRGRFEQIRTARVVDVVWPEDRMNFAEVLPAILDVARAGCDLLSIRGRVGMGLADQRAGLKRRALLAAEGYLISRSPPTSELVTLADLPFADRY
jgi:hypothetical protein